MSAAVFPEQLFSAQSVQNLYGVFQAGFDGRPQKRGATPISYKVLQCPTKLFHTSTFNLKNASPSQAYDCRM